MQSALGTLWFWLALSVHCCVMVECFTNQAQEQPSSRGILSRDKWIAAWDEEDKKIDHRSKDSVKSRYSAFNNILKRVSEKVVRTEVERVSNAHAIFSQQSSFDQMLVQITAERRLAKKQKKELVHLMAGNCPTGLPLGNLDYGLATSKLKDGILLMFEAYEKSTNLWSRVVLIAILRDSFFSISLGHRDDKVFTVQAKQWYETHKGEITVNLEYPQLPGALLFSPTRKSNDLFIFKEKQKPEK